MRKETIITAAVFFSVGFLVGYIFEAQRSWNARQNAAIAGSGGGGTSSVAAGAPEAASARLQELPKGHPPIDTASMIKAFEDQAAQNPRDPRPRLELANYYYDHQQFQQAIDWYQKALELDPKNVNARTDLGTAYFNLGRSDEALREYRQSLKNDPTHEPTLFNMIVVNLEGAHNFRAAREAWDKLYRLNPKYPGLDRLKQNLDAAGAATR